MTQPDKRAVCFGEIMTRLTPRKHNETLASAHEFDMQFAGAESNIACNLSSWGHPVEFVTKLPDNLLGEKAIAYLNQLGTSTSHVKRGGERIGSYYIETGYSIRPSRVVYDRKASAFSEMSAHEFDWKTLLSGAQWLHVSGITCALSETCAEQNLRAVTVAKSLGVKVSFDLNFRRSLWVEPSRATTLFSELLKRTDLALGNAGVVSDVFGYSGEHSAQFLQDKFDLSYVAFTEREHISASENTVSARLLTSTERVKSNAVNVTILDRLGTGDAFASGVLHGLMNDHSFDAQRTVDFANAAFALKHTLWGDHLAASVNDVQAIADGHLSGYVIR